MNAAVASTQSSITSTYAFEHAGMNLAHGYLLPAVTGILKNVAWGNEPKRIFELGCGSGAIAAQLTQQGYDITGVDPSVEGIAHARKAYPNLKLSEGSAYDDLASTYGQFPVLLSLEVVEHVYFPRKYAACAYSLLKPGGTAIISTPYHGYLKNLALALTGEMDKHFTVLWEHGHIKFWSIKTLRQLLVETGFREVQFKRVGRIGPLAKSMIAIAKK
jgi:2-polyprenyl-3-methyl-5-hydroxy-6-metoxy-1,4-benzoquinol methylase